MSNNPAETAKFDLQKFNKEFDAMIKVSRKEQQEKDKKQLGYLNNTQADAKLWDLSISQILINMRTAWFVLFRDIFTLKLSRDTIFAGNNLFYLGISIVLFALTMYIVSISSS
jgi:hypothetical protein